MNSCLLNVCSSFREYIVQPYKNVKQIATSRPLLKVLTLKKKQWVKCITVLYQDLKEEIERSTQTIEKRNKHWQFHSP